MENININISYNNCDCPSCRNKIFPRRHINYPYHPSSHQEKVMLFEKGEYLVPLVVGKEQTHLYAALSTNSPDIVLIDKTCTDNQGQTCLSNKKYGEYDYKNSISCVTVPYDEDCKSQNTMKCSKLTNLGKYEHVDDKRIQETVTEITICDYLDITKRYTKMRVAINIEPKDTFSFSSQPSIIGLSPNNTSGIKYFHAMFDAQKPTITFDVVNKRSKARLMPISKTKEQYFTAYTGYVNNVSYNGNYLHMNTIPVIFASGNTINYLPSYIFKKLMNLIETELEKIFGGTSNNNPLSTNEVMNKQDMINKMPPLIFEFKTKDGKTFKWTIKGQDITTIFKPHDATSKTTEFITLGNTGMLGKELSFDSRNSEPIVTVY